MEAFDDLELIRMIENGEDLPLINSSENNHPNICNRNVFKNDVSNTNGLKNALRNAYSSGSDLGFITYQIKNFMIDTGINYCRDMYCDISVIAMDNMINEIIVNEARKNENSR